VRSVAAGTEVDARPARLLESEARGLLTRLDQVKPFALH
jgi:hypothetical protein